MELDFSGLTDDQLIALIRDACEEARRRGDATETAARNVYLDEVERTRIGRAAELLEAERLRNEESARVAKEAADRVRRDADKTKIDDVANKERVLWAKRKGIAKALDAAGWDCRGDQLVVWMSSAKEKRVFLQKAVYGASSYAIFFVTGNKSHAPESFQFSQSVFGKDKAFMGRVGDVLRAVAEEWNTLKVDLEQALSWDGASIPPKHLTPAAPAEASS